ncbi:DUF1289 domain-containing protein [Azoarcus indigens]|uniref:DUF1289 domain-containing protein n=1 Tax=Azoarcus indigens TaxID=29545 RepID=A0A4R6E133_9RHOO|nr:DUF1289 domain-containing protein [Azoarcus indigens]NMG65546.1 DUF1289 domain-containing protein [Azoarcus indigens]TDN51425.1 hypothetical protein C7389_107160 [Azoarcus indigens]
MSDEACLGLCDIDWESGICNGCGRSTDEIYGEPEDVPAEPEATAAAVLPLPAGQG